MTDVFISYKREEREAVTTMVERLRALRLDVWFDAQLRSAAGFDEEIAGQLNAARCVVVCWTPAAIASEWVRGEAALAHGDGKLVACFFEPTRLLPPFNLQQTEDLTRWAGQDDAQPWLRLLQAIGEHVQRPGIASYAAVMAPGAPLQSLRDWAGAHGADALAESVWARIALIEGEGRDTQLAREALEARARDQRRQADDARSRALAAARGLRDPAEQRRRMRWLGGGLVALGLATVFGVGYAIDAQNRAAALARIDTPKSLRDFIADNRWHPVGAEALRKYQTLDTAAWLAAAGGGQVAIQRYLVDYAGPPVGQFVPAAQAALQAAQRVSVVQRSLARLQFYSGPIDGNADARTRDAVQAFRYASGQPVNDTIDDALVLALQRTFAALPTLPPALLHARRTGAPDEDDYRALAARTGLEAPTLYALRAVEAAPAGFDEQGRPLILFEHRIFSRLTHGVYDDSHPTISNHQPLGYAKRREDNWTRLQEAWELDPAAAYGATTFGLYQITGMHYAEVRLASAGELAWFVAQSETNQLELFVRFLENGGHLARLKLRDWAGFARRYNGIPLSAQYAQRLASAHAEGQQKLGFFAQVAAAPSAASGASSPSAALLASPASPTSPASAASISATR